MLSLVHRKAKGSGEVTFLHPAPCTAIFWTQLLCAYMDLEHASLQMHRKFCLV